jgi:RNA polymerase sigma-70 factor, ECF subfamily
MQSVAGRRRMRSRLPSSADDDIEPAILDRARRGDEDAFSALVRHYDRGLRALAFRLLGDRDRMDDVLQDVYVKAYRALPAFRGGSSVRTWLYRVTYNACLDEIRRARRVVYVPFDGLSERTAADANVVELVGRREGLATALASLAPEDRAAVLLVDAMGFDYAGASEVLDVPGGTVASRLHRARAALRDALSDRSEALS